MRVLIAVPPTPIQNVGNRTTARRIAELLGDAHRTQIATALPRGDFDACIVLHASRSAAAIRAFAHAHPQRRLIVALTGTDIYGEGAPDAEALASLRAAWRIVAAQPLAAERLPADVRQRLRVIPKSAFLPGSSLRVAVQRPAVRAREVVALSHLRAIKDPLLLPRAMALLPASTRLRAVHVGGSLEPPMANAARAMESKRWRWLGPRPRSLALLRLARARCLVLTSLHEGAPNVIVEAAALHRPVLATRIPGVVGMLGASHPGLFDPGDAAALASLLCLLDSDFDFVEELADHSRRLAEQGDPARERLAWETLLAEPLG